jgi:hypothetical protein
VPTPKATDAPAGVEAKSTRVSAGTESASLEEFMVDITFGFMNGRDVYTATIPDVLGMRSEAFSCIRLSSAVDQKSGVQFRSAADFDTGHPDETLRTTMTSAQGSSVTVYDYPSDPPMTLAYWALPVGYLWVGLEASPDGTAALNEVLAGLRVTQDAASVPRITIADPLSPGDITEPAERDSVTYYATDENAMPAAVSFIHSGTEVADSTMIDGDMAVVTAAGPSGISVVCHGPADVTTLTTIAVKTAASIRKGSGTFAGTLDMTITPGSPIFFMPLVGGSDPPSGQFSASGSGSFTSEGGSSAAEGPFSVTASGSWNGNRCIDQLEFRGTMAGASSDGRWKFDVTFGLAIPACERATTIATFWIDKADASTAVEVDISPSDNPCRPSSFRLQGPVVLPADELKLI